MPGGGAVRRVRAHGRPPLQHAREHEGLVQHRRREAQALAVAPLDVRKRVPQRPLDVRAVPVGRAPRGGELCAGVLREGAADELPAVEGGGAPGGPSGVNVREALAKPLGVRALVVQGHGQAGRSSESGYRSRTGRCRWRSVGGRGTGCWRGQGALRASRIREGPSAHVQDQQDEGPWPLEQHEEDGRMFAGGRSHNEVVKAVKVVNLVCVSRRGPTR